MKNTFRYYPNKISGGYNTMRVTGQIINQAISTPSTERKYEIVIPCREE